MDSGSFSPAHSYSFLVVFGFALPSSLLRALTGNQLEIVSKSNIFSYHGITFLIFYLLTNLSLTAVHNPLSINEMVRHHHKKLNHF